MDYAIWLSGSKWDSDTVVEKNTLTNDGIGIILEDGADPTIQNNRIKNFWGLDIYYWSFAARQRPNGRPQEVDTVALAPAASRTEKAPGAFSGGLRPGGSRAAPLGFAPSGSAPLVLAIARPCGDRI
jgi:parallel beta-helix repeat protein